MDEKSILDILEKRGVVLREVVPLVVKSRNYGDALCDVVDNPLHRAQLSEKPPKAFVRVTILLEPIDYEEVV